MISFEEAKDLLTRLVPSPRQTTVNILESLGCVIAEDAVSDINMPPFNKSAMDGYAVISKDTASVPCELEVVEDLPAGRFPEGRVSHGQAARIMTGAPVPPGADAVVMVEDTQSLSPGRVRILKPASRGQHICTMGEDLKVGDVIIKRGSVIRPPEVGVLAAIGRQRVKVYKRPRIAMISTGDELVKINRTPAQGQIRDSNGYSIGAQIQAMRLGYDYLGIARDTMRQLRTKIAEGLRRDVLIISGGVSVGEYDLVVKALQAEGVKEIFHHVLIKPGRPFYFGMRGRKRVFGLPGNPVSTLIIFEVFIRPFLWLMQASPQAWPCMFKAKITSSFSKLSERVQFLPGKLSYMGDEFRIEPIEHRGSADIFAFTRANSIIVVPANSPSIKKGNLVDVIPLNYRYVS